MFSNTTSINNSSTNCYDKCQKQRIFNEILAFFCKVTSLQVFCDFQHHNKFPFHWYTMIHFVLSM